MTDQELEIVRNEHATGGQYSVIQAGAEAVMTYSRASDRLIIIDHTEVPDALRGMGLGQALVARVVADARASDTKIMPLCPFAAAQFRRNRDYDDVMSR